MAARGKNLHILSVDNPAIAKKDLTTTTTTTKDGHNEHAASDLKPGIDSTDHLAVARDAHAEKMELLQQQQQLLLREQQRTEDSIQRSLHATTNNTMRSAHTQEAKDNEPVNKWKRCVIIKSKDIDVNGAIYIIVIQITFYPISYQWKRKKNIVNKRNNDSERYQMENIYFQLFNFSLRSIITPRWSYHKSNNQHGLQIDCMYIYYWLNETINTLNLLRIYLFIFFH